MSDFEIPLTQGYIAVADTCDADLGDAAWHVLVCKSGAVYAKRWGDYKPKRTLLLMHRVILARVLGRPLVAGEQVDHINGNGLDNRRENLRLATALENARNSRRRKDNQSGYKGVYRKSDSRWIAHIRDGVRQREIGRFDTAEEAHAAYQMEAARLFGEYARFE